VSMLHEIDQVDEWAIRWPAGGVVASKMGLASQKPFESILEESITQDFSGLFASGPTPTWQGSEISGNIHPIHIPWYHLVWAWWRSL
jgi:hypothetical protein